MKPEVLEAMRARRAIQRAQRIDNARKALSMIRNGSTAKQAAIACCFSRAGLYRALHELKTAERDPMCL